MLEIYFFGSGNSNAQHDSLWTMEHVHCLRMMEHIVGFEQPDLPVEPEGLSLIQHYQWQDWCLDDWSARLDGLEEIMFENDNDDISMFGTTAPQRW